MSPGHDVSRGNTGPPPHAATAVPSGEGRPRAATVLEALRADVQLFHALKCPGRKATWWTTLRVLLCSRGLLLLVGHRVVSRWYAERPAGRLRVEARRVAMVVLHYFVRVLAKSEIHFDSLLEGGVYLSDRGHMFLGARTIGGGTMVHERVTIGWSLLAEGSPEIGRDVWIGPDTVIAGNVNVGDGATILPGTVLTRSVPAGCVVQGNPAWIVRRGFDNAPLRRTLATDVGQLAAAEMRAG